MSDDATAVTDDATTEDAPEAAEAAAEETTATEAEAVADEATEAEETPQSDAGDASDVEAETETPAEAAVEAVAAVPGVRVARVFVCERGHRTTTLWGTPSICQARVDRKGPVCGLPLYHITELPEQVEKALNPLKASKKASKKK